jgi:hypothetical protein
MNQYQSALTYLESILNHIDGIITYTSEGKFALSLIRGDMAYTSIPVIAEDYLLEPPTFTRKSWLDTMNELKIQYPKRINEPSSMVPTELTLTGATSISSFGNYQYTAAGGLTPYYYSLVGDGVTTIGSTGLVYVLSTNPFTVIVRDSAGQAKSLYVTYVADPEGLTITGDTLISIIGLHVYTCASTAYPCTWTITNFGGNAALFDNGTSEIIISDTTSVNVNIYWLANFMITITDDDGHVGNLYCAAA